ncbi:DNA polymerase III subunit gamma/tau [Lysobacter ciconiae]|uniref:DNA polymerase III subunit gamma/tau n=1 Tax=Novilysobacter ciconiae TaxID=2781022 RepID=A0A7S6ZRX4_9GAMM|nr:DNA polymerase III subunit gamma/tau [Lysobacter ciconiae]QOW18959.1 DNA polymerase III subunit gamma/tau [Lysobacter ciconiae]
MSYLVLARKWRPKRFAELVGQEHVVRALTNALDSGRVHHAFLFSGTRGVGKTTIARIFAKSLNCEQGTSADPCGECNSCRDIDAGRFIDLLEIDAASNTGVDDVRDLIDNAQYMPSRGRVKVYLIDEVHMLSKSAFNALLKTLEEPPGHVKFLLATTDPQKLPVTVLSRCLQFNLKRLDEEQIGGQVEKILQAEGIAVEPGAVRQISRAADGSLRDGLSLLDQAIAYTGGQLTDAAVATMLGTVDQTRVGALLDALASGDGAALMAEVAALAEFSPDWAGVLEALSDALHRIQVRQLVPGASIEVDGVAIDALATRVPAELVQLWYQMAINGRRDLSLAPSQRAGFEMSVLRMLAFRPAGPQSARSGPASGGTGVTAGGIAGAGSASGPASASASAHESLLPATPRPAPTPTRARAPTDTGIADVPAEARPETPEAAGRSPDTYHHDEREQAPFFSLEDESEAVAVATTAPEPTASVSEPHPAPHAASDEVPAGAVIADADAWHAWVVASPLKGPARVLAEHVGFIACEGRVVRLGLSPQDELLNKPVLVAQIVKALATSLGGDPEIRFEASTVGGVSLRERNDKARDARRSAAVDSFMSDPQVRALIAGGATVVADSIRPRGDA